MACPYFQPTQRLSDDLWPRPAWLPLAGGWRGQCSLSATVPDDHALREFCNLGYATSCPRLPPAREADSVRFGVKTETEERLEVVYVIERAHLPVSHGTLAFDRTRQAWIQLHPDARIQKLAACYLEAHLARRM